MASLVARLYLLFTPSLCRRDPWDTLARALEGGVDLVQWRVKADARADLARCMQVCGAAGVALIVNDHVELAVEVGAAGAHVGQEDMPAAAARQRLGDGKLLGVSTHDEAQIHAAQAAGADYVGFGPCYPTSTKGYTEGLGPARAAAAARSTTLPLFALGGIDALRARELVAAGCARVAVSSAILGATDPRRAARALRAVLDRDDRVR
jgi:thiamine-phosphate pyrophosphorylase